MYEILQLGKEGRREGFGVEEGKQEGVGLGFGGREIRNDLRGVHFELVRLLSKFSRGFY